MMSVLEEPSLHAVTTLKRMLKNAGACLGQSKLLRSALKICFAGFSP